MVGRVKGNPRKMIIPPRLSPYVLGPRSKRPRPNPQYSLTPEEDMILDKFWNGYYKKVPELDQICSRVSTKNLRQCLRKLGSIPMYVAIMDSNIIMDCWFEILEAKVPTTHFFPSSLAHWEQNNLTDYYCIAFGKERLRDLDNDADWEYIRHFVLFITKCFSQLGWDDPAHWPTVPHAYPKQDNEDDYGVFVMAYTEHLVLDRRMQFIQSNM
ncbi:hypothetical protein MRB53_016149 [Persea americana]|uniref:Uncharacterized protein n=1 Tax=Persea americana TaxID=3435 RepID=A0ACC2M1D9_PERAE|nr:hypothetical protein MRB53_016149 [Persea americana]